MIRRAIISAMVAPLLLQAGGLPPAVAVDVIPAVVVAALAEDGVSIDAVAVQPASSADGIAVKPAVVNPATDADAVGINVPARPLSVPVDEVSVEAAAVQPSPGADDVFIEAAAVQVSPDIAYIAVEPAVVKPTTGTDVVSVEAVAVQAATGEDEVFIAPVGFQPAEGAELEPPTLETWKPAATADSLSLWRHPLFRTAAGESTLWDHELGKFADPQDLGQEPLPNADRLRFVVPRFQWIMQDVPELKPALLEEREAGFNALVVEYRVGNDHRPVVDFIAWATNHFDYIVLGLSAHVPWPSPDELRGVLADLLEHADGAITAWGPTIDLGSVFGPGDENTARFRTVQLISRWIDHEVVALGKSVIGYRHLDIHGPSNRPSKPGSKSGGVFDHTPVGAAAYLVANAHPEWYGTMMMPPDALQARIGALPDGVPVMLGPFMYRGGDMLRLNRLAMSYNSMGYGVVKLLVGPTW